MTPTMSGPALAAVLFASTLQPSDDPPPDRIRRTVEDLLRASGGSPTTWTAHLAQEAGDHPETYATRMRWALDAVARAYSAYPTNRIAA